jgi:hypothetical protein
MDNRSFVTSLNEQQNSFSRQPCRPQRGPLLQWIDLLPSNASVVLVVTVRPQPSKVPGCSHSCMAASRVDGPNGDNVVTEADSPPPPVIKIYVITDATTAFVLRVLIYTRENNLLQRFGCSMRNSKVRRANQD